MKQGVVWIAVAVSLGSGLACRESGPEAEETATSAARGGDAPFRAPADGRLTERQLEMYAEVREHLSASGPESLVEPRGEQVVEDLARLSRGELAAAEALGHDPAEYAWVRARVMEARLPELGADAMGVPRRMTRAALETLRQRRDQAQDPEERARLDEQIAELEAGLEEAPAPSAAEAALLHNRRLLERHLEDEAPDEGAGG